MTGRTQPNTESDGTKTTTADPNELQVKMDEVEMDLPEQLWD
jgi:hypothetical protein